MIEKYALCREMVVEKYRNVEGQWRTIYIILAFVCRLLKEYYERFTFPSIYRIPSQKVITTENLNDTRGGSIGT